MFANVYLEIRLESRAFASETCLRAFLMAARSSLEMLEVVGIARCFQFVSNSIIVLPFQRKI